MSLAMLIVALVAVFVVALGYSILLESILGYRKERRNRRDRRVIELRKHERRQSPFPWHGPENRCHDRRHIQRRILDRRSDVGIQAA
jgi:hypothetical protein